MAHSCECMRLVSNTCVPLLHHANSKVACCNEVLLGSPALLQVSVYFAHDMQSLVLILLCCCKADPPCNYC